MSGAQSGISDEKKKEDKEREKQEPELVNLEDGS